MNAPDVAKHLKDIIGGLVIELATAKALIEQHEKASTEVKAQSERRGAEAQGAHESRTET